MIAKLKRIYRYLFRNPPKFRIATKQEVEHHGTDYGGWTIVKDSLNENSAVLSFGIGMDYSFDASIIKKYKCKVNGFDPTPRVAQWLKTQNTPSRFIFHPVGIAVQDGTVDFYLPLDDNNISHSAINLGQGKTIAVPCERLTTIAKKLNLQSIDVLKMDIEGFEYEVIRDIIKSELRPKQMLIEFHHMFKEYGNKPTEDSIAFLDKNGYKLFHVSDTFTEYSFIYIG